MILERLPRAIIKYHSKRREQHGAAHTSAVPESMGATKPRIDWSDDYQKLSVIEGTKNVPSITWSSFGICGTRKQTPDTEREIVLTMTSPMPAPGSRAMHSHLPPSSFNWLLFYVNHKNSQLCQMIGPTCFYVALAASRFMQIQPLDSWNCFLIIAIINTMNSWSILWHEQLGVFGKDTIWTKETSYELKGFSPHLECGSRYGEQMRKRQA